MNLEEHYNKLYTESIEKISNGNYEVDKLLNTKDDNRFGITLVIRPDEKTKANIQHFLNEIKSIEPNQYYYQNSDIHVTVMSIISCYSGFNLNNINTKDYIALIAQILKKHKKFNLQFKGITASSSCILLQGFFEDNTLNEIRDQLRKTFKDSLLEQSIDQRYAIQTAHSTVIRFKTELADVNNFLSTLERFRNFDFGTFEVSNIELVYNDWYQRDEFVKKLHVFEL